MKSTLGSGHIIELGLSITDFKLGDPILLSFSYCRAGPNRKAGHSAYCDQFMARNLSGGRLDGSSALRDAEIGAEVCGHSLGRSLSAYHVVAHESALVKVGDEVDLRFAAP